MANKSLNSIRKERMSIMDMAISVMQIKGVIMLEKLNCCSTVQRKGTKRQLKMLRTKNNPSCCFMQAHLKEAVGHYHYV